MMADDLTVEDIQKDVEQLEGQLGAISKYVKELWKELLQEEVALEQHHPDEAVKDINTAKRLVRASLARTERYLNREANHVKQDIVHLKANLTASLLQQVDHTDQVLEIGLNKLVEAFSRNQGSVPADIKRLNDEVTALEQSPNPAAEAKVIQDTKAVMGKLKTINTWVAGDITEIESFKKFLEYLKTL